LDRTNAQCIEDALQQLHLQTQLTIILASHDPRLVEGLARRVVTLDDGRLT
jgi:ABC-type glutathione transport system ATPase component